MTFSYWISDHARL